MGSGNWIQGAIANPGALSRQAKAAGKTTAQFSRDVLTPGDHADAKTKRRARLAQTLAKLRARKKNG